MTVIEVMLVMMTVDVRNAHSDSGISNSRLLFEVHISKQGVSCSSVLVKTREDFQQGCQHILTTGTLLRTIFKE